MAEPRLATVTSLVDAQAAARARLSAAARAAVVSRLLSGGRWWDSAAITAMATQMVRMVEATQRQAAAVTDAYLARVASEIAGSRIGPVGVGAALKLAELRGGTPHRDVYGRLADQYRWLLSSGKSADLAQRMVVRRAEQLAEMDVSLAVRDQSRRFMVVRRVDGYRRVVHPELSAGGVCGLCIVASDRVYKADILMPIHEHCRCEAMPIINGVDPGRTLNGQELDAFYRAAGSNRAKDLKRTRYVVREHGELGPVLTNADHSFRGPEDLAA